MQRFLPRLLYKYFISNLKALCRRNFAKLLYYYLLNISMGSLCELSLSESWIIKHNRTRHLLFFNNLFAILIINSWLEFIIYFFLFLHFIFILFIYSCLYFFHQSINFLLLFSFNNIQLNHNFIDSFLIKITLFLLFQNFNINLAFFSINKILQFC